MHLGQCERGGGRRTRRQLVGAPRCRKGARDLQVSAEHQPVCRVVAAGGDLRSQRQGRPPIASLGQPPTPHSGPLAAASVDACELAREPLRPAPWLVHFFLSISVGRRSATSGTTRPGSRRHSRCGRRMPDGPNPTLCRGRCRRLPNSATDTPTSPGRTRRQRALDLSSKAARS